MSTSTSSLNATTLAPNPSPLTPPHLYLPPGQLTLLIGDPGTGKSLLAIDLAARLSHSHPMPPAPAPSSPVAPPTGDNVQSNPAAHPNQAAPSQTNFPNSTNSTNFTNSTTLPSSIILLSYEDSLDTLAQRYILAAGHPDRIHFINRNASLLDAPEFDPTFDDVAHTPYLLSHLKMLCKKSPAPRLFIIDPLPALLGSADSYSATLLRDRLAPLLNFALDNNIALLGITHLAKPTAKNKNPLHRILGSLAYPALARAIYHITYDPRDARTRLVIPLKHNLAPLTHAFSFTLENKVAEQPAHFKDPSSPDYRPLIGDFPAPVLRWNPDPIPLDPSESLSDERDSIAQSQLQFACDFLTTTLKDGPLPSTTLLRQSRKLGITLRTLERARYLLRITSEYNRQNKKWLTTLPPT